LNDKVAGLTELGSKQRNIVLLCAALNVMSYGL